jgi:hypothetical protein
MKTFQELADEAFRDLLHKYGRPTDLKAALRESAGASAAQARPTERRPRGKRRCTSLAYELNRVQARRIKCAQEDQGVR